jgi:hypothetical protein
LSKSRARGGRSCAARPGCRAGGARSGQDGDRPVGARVEGADTFMAKNSPSRPETSSRPDRASTCAPASKIVSTAHPRGPMVATRRPQGLRKQTNLMGVLKGNSPEPRRRPSRQTENGDTGTTLRRRQRTTTRIIADFTSSANGRRPDQLRATQTALQSRTSTQNNGICRVVVPEVVRRRDVAALGPHR